MNEPINIQSIRDVESFKYDELKESLKKSSLEAKRQLLESDLGLIPIVQEDKIEYIIDLIEILQHLVLFADEVVMTKLKKMGIDDSITRWLVDFDEINLEIEKLNNKEGLFVFKSGLLSAINSHLIVKIFNEILLSFGFDRKHNNAKTNILYKSFDNLFNRDKYQHLTPNKKKYNLAEYLVLIYLKNLKLELNIEDQKKIDKNFLKLVKADTSIFIQVFNHTYNYGYSKRKTYIQFFPLLQKILLDKNLLNEEDFGIEKDEFYDALYDEYQNRRIRKILTKK